MHTSSNTHGTMETQTKRCHRLSLSSLCYPAINYPINMSPFNITEKNDVLKAVSLAHPSGSTAKA